VNVQEPPRRRPALVVSGWLLFVCLFLPTLRVCGQPTLPVEFPPTYGIYLGGLVIALIAASRQLRRRRFAFAALAAIYSTMLGVIAVGIGAGLHASLRFVLALAALAYAIVFTRKVAISERIGARTIATGCTVHSIIALGWTALIAGDPDRMWGAYVALGASTVLLFGSLAMCFAAFSDHRARRAWPLPLARINA